MALQAVAQGAVKMGQGAAKLTQGVAQAGRQSFRASEEATRASRMRMSANQARQQGPSSPLRELPSSQPLQSEAARRTSLQSAMRQAQNPLRQPAQAARAQENDDADQEEEEQEEQQKVSFQSFMQSMRIKGALTDAAGVEQKGNGGAPQQIVQQTAQKKIDKAVISNPIALFVWLNLQMTVGKKIPLVGPLRWPIPMPIDQNGSMLRGIVLTVDMIVLVFAVISLATNIILLLLTNPVGQALLIVYFGKQFFSGFF